jgi:hypothetical protein
MKSPTPGPHGELCSCRGWGPHVYSQKDIQMQQKKTKKEKRKRKKQKHVKILIPVCLFGCNHIVFSHLVVMTKP